MNRPDPSALSASVWHHLHRLGARLDPRERTAVEQTSAGPRTVPPAVQTLLGLRWPEKRRLYASDGRGREVTLPMGPFPLQAGPVSATGAWLAVGEDTGQYYWAVDLDDPVGDDPLIHLIDHDGGDHDTGPRGGRPLSRALAALTATDSPRPCRPQRSG